ncbi:siderophore-interacting protein [Zavarzinia compransoris]|uniref:Siderophore-interacting FAD-binding domain-containing protein n=1 Tax=Zavarzinia compransoris TaxID=1264899 RepID=A0A317E6F1_9PROT|nr:siderophore-interacting protein [Zavarzinia compransoris]PWR21796.1 hypothetical protein DKG75_07345 [Zavarzinia compransoris]TDP45404.1 siderophore-interacting protein [Zavarzinia compransoris]
MSGLRTLTVVGAEHLTPHMRRITLKGDIGALLSPDDMHCRLFVPVPGGGTAARKYTIRRFDAAAGLIDVDVALHGDGGPGAA